MGGRLRRRRPARAGAAMTCARCGRDCRTDLYREGRDNPGVCADCQHAQHRAQAHPRALPQVGLPWAPKPKPRPAVPGELFPNDGGPRP
jgi:hypothetical protein